MVRIAAGIQRVVFAALRIVLPADERDAVIGDLEEAARRRGPGSPFRSTRDALRALPLALRERRRAARPVRRSGGELSTWVSEVQSAIRRLRRRPAATLVAATILSVGAITGTTAYGLFDVLERVESGLDLENLVILQLREADPPRVVSRQPFERFRALRQASLPARPAASYHGEVVVRTADATTTEHSAAVSPEYFALLRVPLFAGQPPALGSAAPEAVVSYGFWRARLGATRDAIGTTIDINAVAHRIVGIAAPEVRGTSGNAAVWRVFDPQGSGPSLSVFFRTDSNAPAELEALKGRISTVLTDTGDDDPATVELMSAEQLSLSTLDRIGAGDTSARMVLAMALLLALATAANAANVLLAEHVDRRSEFAVRRAIGAGRGRLLSQMVSEAVLRAVLVTGMTLLGSRLAMYAIQGWNPTPIVPGFDRSPGLPPGTIAYAVVVAAVASLVASLGPAGTLLRRSGKANRPRSRRTDLLAVTQVTIATTLLIAAATVTLAVLRIHDRPLGYAEADRYFYRVNLSAVSSDPQALRSTTERLVRDLAAHPQILSSGVVDTIPAFQRAFWTATTPEHEMALGWMAVDSGYIETVGLELLGGRMPDPEAAHEVLLSASAATGLSPAGAAIGTTFRLGRDETSRLVVGIVGDGTYTAPEVVPMVLSPPYSRPASTLIVVVHSTASPSLLRTEFQRVAAAIDPMIPEAEPVPLVEWFERAWYLERTSSAIIRLFALVSLLISALGLYATFVHLVNARRRDLAVRLALGATPAGIFRTVQLRGLVTAGAGAGLGSFIAFIAAGSLQSLVFGLTAPSAGTYAAAAGTVAVATALALLAPGLRAASTDPAGPLRG